MSEGGGGGELGPFVPDFLTRIPDLPPPTAMNAQGQRYRLFETVNALLASVSRMFPVLLLIDDLHWADKPTLSLLRHIVRGSDPAALCVVGTYRESELATGHPLAELLADLRREQAVTRISLGGLERQQVGMLVETVASSAVSAALTEQLADGPVAIRSSSARCCAICTRPEGSHQRLETAPPKSSALTSGCPKACARSSCGALLD